MKMDLNLVQLLAYTDWNETMVYQGDQATPYDYDWMFAEGGMAKSRSTPMASARGNLCWLMMLQPKTTS